MEQMLLTNAHRCRSRVAPHSRFLRAEVVPDVERAALVWKLVRLAQALKYGSDFLVTHRKNRGSSLISGYRSALRAMRSTIASLSTSLHSEQTLRGW